MNEVEGDASMGAVTSVAKVDAKSISSSGEVLGVDDGDICCWNGVADGSAVGPLLGERVNGTNVGSVLGS